MIKPTRTNSHPQYGTRWKGRSFKESRRNESIFQGWDNGPNRLPRFHLPNKSILYNSWNYPQLRKHVLSPTFAPGKTDRKIFKQLQTSNSARQAIFKQIWVGSLCWSNARMAFVLIITPVWSKKALLQLLFSRSETREFPQESGWHRLPQDKRSTSM